MARALLARPGALPTIHVLGESIGCDFGGAIDGSGVRTDVSWWGASVPSVHGSWPATTIEHDSVSLFDRVADGAKGEILLNHVGVGIGGRLEVGDLECFFESLPKAVHRKLKLVVRCTASLGEVVHHHHR